MPRHHARMKYEDYLAVIKDRDVKKLTYEQIARKLDVTRQRVENIYRIGKEMERTKDIDPLWGLPIRAISVFTKMGLKDKAQVLEAIQEHKLHPLTIGANYGWRTHNEVLTWLGLPQQNRLVAYPVQCPKCGHKFQ